jgi:DNA repair protein RadC
MMEDYSKQSIRNWSVEDRPREKMLAKGLQSLTNAELIALLICSGTRDKSAVDLARQVLTVADNNLNTLGKLTVNKLQKLKGIGQAKAISIVAALELGRRRKLSEIPGRPKITGSKDVYELLLPMLSDLSHEEFWILLLNRSNKIIDRIKVSQGGTAGTVIDVKMILGYAIDKLASSIIICHNHPSGNTEPSKADIEITVRIRNAAKVMDIKLLDHIIIAENLYFSFLDEGLLDPN